MLEVRGNVWEVYSSYDAFCITTNGVVKRDGGCVMGRGIAREAKERFPGIDLVLGRSIKLNGNRVVALGKVQGKYLCSFPVKHKWNECADLKLIELSVTQLIALADKYKWERVLLPRPGVGNGKLSWELVKPIVERLDDRFSLITF